MNTLTGRDLDHAIAELMGDTVSEDGLWSTDDGKQTIWCADGGPWHYSTDMNAAMRVWERFGDEWQLNNWQAKWVVFVPFRSMLGVSVHSPAEAICLAALQESVP